MEKIATLTFVLFEESGAYTKDIYVNLATLLVCSAVLGKNPARILLNWRFLTKNIDVEALQVAFESLRGDGALIKPSLDTAILIAACMLQLDGLIQQCGESMQETINGETVCGYYTLAGTYGLYSVRNKCLEWLLNSLVAPQNIDLFKELSRNVMQQLMNSSDLFVIQVEMDVCAAPEM